MEKMKLKDHPHRRYNPLTGEWILVSPHRTKRPWQGAVEKQSLEERPGYEPNCYLCPGNKRAGGHVNPQYKDTYVFDNDFAALLEDSPNSYTNEKELLISNTVNGVCRVICFSPKHNLTIPDMEIKDIRKVIDLWIDQYIELGDKYTWVQIFENKGEIMGCSNPHPHGQIWATDTLPNEAQKEEDNQKVYFEKNGSPLLVDYLNLELKKKERIVVENDHWIVLVPYWAVWPYETILLPKRSTSSLIGLTEYEKITLAEILKLHLKKYDELFNVSFPYTMGWHSALFNKSANDHWHLHAHFYPPLLRSATVKKFMVGYEMLAEAQRDITAEQAAAVLREL